MVWGTWHVSDLHMEANKPISFVSVSPTAEAARYQGLAGSDIHGYQSRGSLDIKRRPRLISPRRRIRLAVYNTCSAFSSFERCRRRVTCARRVMASSGSKARETSLLYPGALVANIVDIANSMQLLAPELIRRCLYFFLGLRG